MEDWQTLLDIAAEHPILGALMLWMLASGACLFVQSIIAPWRSKWASNMAANLANSTRKKA